MIHTSMMRLWNEHSIGTLFRFCSFILEPCDHLYLMIFFDFFFVFLCTFFWRNWDGWRRRRGWKIWKEREKLFVTINLFFWKCKLCIRMWIMSIFWQFWRLLKNLRKIIQIQGDVSDGIWCCKIKKILELLKLKA